MMKIKMTQTREGATDESGTQGMTYEKGKKYEVHDSLAENFLGQDAAKEDRGKEKAPENKEEAPENKELEKEEEEEFVGEDKEPEGSEDTGTGEGPIGEEIPPEKEGTKKKK